jgi:cytosine/adenosine deaminase-related metal-dependent hydrolase
VPLTYWAEYACLPAGVTPSVRLTIEDGRFIAIEPGDPGGATVLRGLTLPGLANGHSHAFHRALRSRTQTGRGSFWTWRERMYAMAGRLDPASYLDLARATFAEMVLAGVTSVGEFHYLHHAPGGTPYADPNEMGEALLTAAAEAGLRITLLDTLYLTSTVDGKPVEGPQLRFSDGSVDAWATRVSSLKPRPHALVGTAVHSIRAVPAPALAEVSKVLGRGPAPAEDAASPTRSAPPKVGTFLNNPPLHVHLSEQRAENEACRAVYGRTPTELLESSGLLGPLTTVVHATHLTQGDVGLLWDTHVCLCPTTERDLADGIGPGRALADAGARLCLGSDSHAMIDLFEEARAVELDERLRTEERGHFDAGELLTAATAAGHTALGWPDAGRLAVGARADLVTVRLDTVRTAGHDDPLLAVLFGATAGDVTEVVVDGRPTVHEGRHLLVPDVARRLDDAIAAVWR